MSTRQASLASSDTLSVRSHASSRRELTKIIVVLPSKEKLLVPLKTSMTVAELQVEILRRASSLNAPAPEGEFNIRSDSKNGPIAFPEDAVIDVLDGDDKATVWLVPTPTEMALNAPDEPIYIRWITPARALDFPTLSTIPFDRNPVSRETSIHELRRIATERIYLTASSTEAPVTPNLRLELYLSACALSTTNDTETTLADLQCRGSLDEPLNIFLVPTSGASADADNPEALWGFQSSERGTAAFQTCLKVFIAHIRKQDSGTPQRLLLKTLFKVTHFPPALEALHTLVTENKLVPKSVAVLAVCFRELALRMIPAHFLCQTIKSALEASRQIFYWLKSKNIEPSDEVDDPEAALVRSVEFKEITDDFIRNQYKVGKRCDIIEFEASGDPMKTSSSSLPRSKRYVKVWTHSNCQEDVRLLALAMWGYYDQDEDYYVDFRDAVNHPFDHKRLALPSHQEFAGLLADTNSDQDFRMVASKDLVGCQSAITLSKEGYVSVFGMNLGHFKDVQPTTWNSISRTEMLDPNFAVTLSTSLVPIIKQRKLEGNWDLDDWAYTRKVEPDLVSPQEAVVICFDLSSSMDDRLGDSWTGKPNSFSKLDEIKQVFENVIARMIGYHLHSNHIGVVTFSSSNQINVETELSRLQLSKDFQKMMGNKFATGCTALWDAIRKAKDMLVEFKSNHPKAKLRIIALTDGCDNDSLTRPNILCKELYDQEIVLDSLVVGSDSGTDLFKMSKHTGGYAFKPTSRLLLYQIFLLEPFLDISARPDIERIPIANYFTSLPKKIDMADMYDFPRCRPHPFEEGSYISLSQAGRFFGTKSAPAMNQNGTATLATRLLPDRGPPAYLSPMTSSRSVTLASADTLSISSGRSVMSSGKIFLGEISFILANEQPFLDIYINEGNMSFWKVVMEGPSSSPYKNGTFLLTVELTNTFPQTPPLVRFATPILHPNITKHGRVCHRIFSDGWKETYHVHTVLQYMYDLLNNPEPSDAVDELATTKYWTDQDTANAEIRKYTNRFATKSRMGWKSEIMNA